MTPGPVILVRMAGVRGASVSLRGPSVPVVSCTLLSETGLPPPSCVSVNLSVCKNCTNEKICENVDLVKTEVTFLTRFNDLCLPSFVSDK